MEIASLRMEVPKGDTRPKSDVCIGNTDYKQSAFTRTTGRGRNMPANAATHLQKYLPSHDLSKYVEIPKS